MPSEPKPRAEFDLRIPSDGELPLLIEIDDDACQLYEVCGVKLGLTAESPFARAERARWARCLAEGSVFLATGRAGESLGFAACGWIDGEPYLDQLSVRLSAIRRGIGTALIERAGAWARERGGRRLWLTTYGHLPFNRPMYERRGFSVVPEAVCGPEIVHHLDEQRRCLPLPNERVAMRRPG